MFGPLMRCDSPIAVVDMQATITEISDGTDVDLRKGRDEEVLEMLMANPKVRHAAMGRLCCCACLPRPLAEAVVILLGGHPCVTCQVLFAAMYVRSMNACSVCIDANFRTMLMYSCLPLIRERDTLSRILYLAYFQRCSWLQKAGAESSATAILLNCRPAHVRCWCHVMLTPGGVVKRRRSPAGNGLHVHGQVRGDESERAATTGECLSAAGRKHCCTLPAP